MSEILTIDTTASLPPSLQQSDRIDPLPVFGEEHPLLMKRMPEYTGGYPAPALVKLAKRLKMTMKLYSGLGLSANQCGVSERIFVMGTEDFQLVCINPKVIEHGTNEKGKEGCLSFPGLFLNVERPEWIVVEFTDENGTVSKTRLDGISARCFLHELDHLNGIKYTELVKPLALKMARQKANKIVKKIVRDQNNGK
jgi:peptide deformylase